MVDKHQTGSKTVESKIRRITKISISEEITKQIMDLISSGALKLGQRLPSERELCQHFGASRSSLREALRCLSIVGVLNARVGEGTSVAADGGKFLRKIMEWKLVTEKHDIEKLLEVRIALEGLSAACTAVQGTEEDIDGLRKLIAKMGASLKDEKAFAALDLEFHVTLANLSGNNLLADLISLIRSQLAKALHKVLHIRNALPLSHEEHTAIFKAIERHDPVAAREAMHVHLKAHLQRYVDAFAGSGPPSGKTSAKTSGKITGQLKKKASPGRGAKKIEGQAEKRSVARS
jgi:GntR family transcriptional regulator, transcriptional repressor for pyruvate dehydrogenase complex